MNEYVEIGARFRRETAKHRMEVLHAEGLYRHLRFSPPDGWGRFDLVTWPYNLIIRGGWTFAFTIDATVDMFDVFRNTARPGEINPGYWSQKVVAGRDDVEGFSEELLRSEIDQTVKGWVEGLPREEADGLREAVREHFFGDMADYNVEYAEEARRALHEFSYGAHYKATCVCGMGQEYEYEYEARAWRHRHLEAHASTHPKGVDPVSIVYDYGYLFHDWYEWRLTEFTPGFLWSCHAIRHGIDVWDAARQEVAA